MYPISLREKFGIRFRNADTGGGGEPPGGGAPAPGGGQPPAVGGGAAAHWAQPLGLPADHLGFLQTKGYKSLTDAISGHINAEKAIGADKLPLPPKGADGNRDWTKWDGWSQIGRPDKPEAYQVKAPEGYEFTEHDKAFHQAILPLAHQAGLAQWQVDILADGFNGFSGGMRQQSAAEIGNQMTAATEALRQKFGAAFDVKMDLANRATAHFFGDDLIGAIDKSGLGRNAAFVERMAALGELMAEDNRLPGGGKPSGGVLDPAGAQKEISRLEGEAMAAMNKGESHPGWDKSHLEYAVWQTKRQDLYKQAGG